MGEIFVAGLRGPYHPTLRISAPVMSRDSLELGTYEFLYKSPIWSKCHSPSALNAKVCSAAVILYLHKQDSLQKFSGLQDIKCYA